MTIKQETVEAMNFLEQTYLMPRSKILLDFAKKQGLADGSVTLPNGEVHAAALFAQHLYYNAYTIGMPSEDAANETYQIVSLLVTLEEISKSNWTYGSKLIYLLKSQQIELTQEEIAAFLAQEGTFVTNPSKSSLMNGNLLAVSIYCGRLRSIYYSLPDISRGLLSAESETYKTFLGLFQPSPQATIEKLALKYIPALIGEDNMGLVVNFLKCLRYKYDFYTAPASNYQHLVCTGGLAEHVTNVIYRTAEQLVPETDAQVGEIVMAALLHDICQANKYKPHSEIEGYYINDDMPFGHGRKSLFIGVSFFGKTMPESVAAAIDGHMHDVDENPNVGMQMMEHPLALFLHIGDMLARHIDDFCMEG